MMKKKIFFLLAAIVIIIPILALSLLKISSASAKEDAFVGRYSYPSIDTSEWEKASTEEKITMCRIPQEVLDSMTEEQLVQAVYDFPFLVNAFVYSALKDGVRNIERNSDAYAELLKRKGAKDALLQKITEVFSEQQEERNAWKKDALAVLALYQEDIVEKMSAEEVQSVASFSSMVDAGYVEEIIKGK